jgi:hypothetical protein
MGEGIARGRKCEMHIARRARTTAVHAGQWRIKRVALLCWRGCGLVQHTSQQQRKTACQQPYKKPGTYDK